MDFPSTSSKVPAPSPSLSTSPAEEEKLASKRKRQKSEEINDSTEINSRSVKQQIQQPLALEQKTPSAQGPTEKREIIKHRIVQALEYTSTIMVGSFQGELGKGGHNTVKIHRQSTTPEGRDRAIKEDRGGYTTQDPGFIMVRLKHRSTPNGTHYTINFVGRNVFAYRLNVLLGMHLVVECRPGTLKGQLVLAMEQAEGEPPTGMKWKLIEDPSLEEELNNNVKGKVKVKKSKGQWFNKIKYAVFRKTGFWATTYDSENRLWGCFRTVSPKINFEDPLLRKQLSQLSIHHYLTRMTDGHFGNMLMKFGPENQFLGLKSFDYDFSSVEGNGTLEETKKLPGSYFSGLPAVIDRETLDTIHELKAEDILDCRHGTELRGEEVQTHLLVLGFLKEHYAYDKAGTDFYIVDNDSEWESKEVAEHLYTGDGYFAVLVKYYRDEHGKLPPPLEDRGAQERVVVQEERPVKEVVCTLPLEEEEEEEVEELDDTFSASGYAQAIEGKKES